ncbi:hypothetical protein BCR32DRAFT_275242 [Anaeromyces robustus]|uniref:Uncharacterized protein n=1 Tax=Anaeromyces robustus TaxID=1754192 RepID=A0A1Y1XLH0_9FUNG|nr:hypothetical protein BCR32DRAFT_275242 [Anaeromyces robustus]|eukprot:ORX86600.1 hypothetical protein BCR32DRAFT_275242 [Anaeromyces robustus]
MAASLRLSPTMNSTSSHLRHSKVSEQKVKVSFGISKHATLTVRHDKSEFIHREDHIFYQELQLLKQIITLSLTFLFTNLLI